MSTPSPYLRDRLLQAADGLRKDAETARLNVAAAEQDVAAARALLQEAEAHAARAQAEVDSIGRGIAWLEREAAHLAVDPDDDPAAKLKATGLMLEEPKPVPRYDNGRVIPPPGPIELDPDHVPAADAWNEAHPVGTPVLYWPAERTGPGTVSHTRSQAWVLGHGAAVVSVEGYAGGIALTHVIPLAEADDDLTAPGVADSRAQIAPHLPPPTPHEPAGVPVATSGPLMTMPDTGLNPAPLPPADVTAEPRHAKPADRPGLLARLTGGHRIVHDEQDGDA